jgi:DNA-binding NarL/FixJ family response regulator
MSGEPIRVLLADDHTVVRVGIRSLLSAARDIEVVGEASTGREAVAMTSRLQPDVVLMDVTMPDGDGVAATKEIVTRGLGARVLVLTMHAEDDVVIGAMEAGASGYLVKTEADRELIDAIRTVARGGTYVRSTAARALARKRSAHDPFLHEKETYERLTERERRVLQLVGMGYSAPEIGERLRISPKTVDTYKQRIHEKTGLAHRSQFVQFAYRLGLLTSV